MDTPEAKSEARRALYQSIDRTKTALLLVDKVVGALRAGRTVEGVEPTEVRAVERARRALLWLEN